MKAEYVDHMGDDLRVVNAARVSFDKESGWERKLVYEFYGENDYVEREWANELKPGDVKLITYLATHGHWTPFSHPQITVRETVPIFVARQRFKHMIGFTYNEVSRRYVDNDPEFYKPEVWRARAENKKQGSSDEAVETMWDENSDGHVTVNNAYERLLWAAESCYRGMLKAGVCPEQARMVLPQSMYTSYYVTGSLAAWARMYKQRVDAHAQAEIQELAHKVGAIIEPLFPVSWGALTT